MNIEIQEGRPDQNHDNFILLLAILLLTLFIEIP